MKPSIRYQREKYLPASELEDLYNSVGWGAYTSDLEALVSGVENSRYVVTARDDNGTLLGLARIVGDGHTIGYLQDILVRPTTQRQGIGRELMNRVFQPFMHCRQHVLITDGEDKQRKFYEALGFCECRDFTSFESRCFLRFQN